MVMAASGDHLAILSQAGYKQRDPQLDVFNLSQTNDEWNQNHESNVNVGFLHLATRLALDPTRRLVWAADENRIKSYKCAFSGSATKSLPVHTFDSGMFQGPITTLDSGSRIMRSGSGQLGVWNVEEAPTHGPRGKVIIGQKLSRSTVEDTSRDVGDFNEIERSAGNPADQTVSLQPDVARCGIRVWSPHPSDARTMLCAGSKEYRAFQLDIESGSLVTRWLGHGAYINQISTCEEEPHAFVTCAGDGVVRLYDVRQPTPSFAGFNGAEQMETAILVQVDGLPCKWNCSLLELYIPSI